MAKLLRQEECEDCGELVWADDDGLLYEDAKGDYEHECDEEYDEDEDEEDL